MTDLTKKRILTLFGAACEGSLAVMETPEGCVVVIVDDEGFIPLAKVWPDEGNKAKVERKLTIGFLPPVPTDGIVN